MSPLTEFCVCSSFPHDQQVLVADVLLVLQYGHVISSPLSNPFRNTAELGADARGLRLVAMPNRIRQKPFQLLDATVNFLSLFKVHSSGSALSKDNGLNLCPYQSIL